MAAIDLFDLTTHLDELLDCRSWDDFGPNGLQVEGRREVRRVVTGVTACHALLAAARERRADAVIVHHGLYWKNLPPVATGWMQRRLLELLPHGISLLAYHLPLDAHPELGNNVLGARALGLEALCPFAPWGRGHIGFRGRFAVAVSPTELIERCRFAFDGHEPLLLGAGPATIETVGLVSGGAQSELYKAIDARLDAYITGEASEWVTHIARECGIHYLAAGHHATERAGVRALGEYLAERFGLDVDFVDVPNPV
jgi:dinuclear metal center YbgI/SA1388 family protein